MCSQPDKATTSSPAGRSSTGDAQRSAARILRYFGQFLVVVACLSLIAFAYIAIAETRLAMSGVTAQATVIDLRTHSYWAGKTYGGGNGTVVNVDRRTDHYVTVRFGPNGHDHQLERAVSEDFFRSTARGRTVEVRYLPNDPETIRLDPDRAAWGLWVAGLLAMVFGLCGWLFLKVSAIAAATRASGSQEPTS